MIALWRCCAFSRVNPLVRAARGRVVRLHDYPKLPLPLRLKHSRYKKVPEIQDCQSSFAAIWILLRATPKETLQVSALITLYTLLRLTFPVLLQGSLQSLESNAGTSLSSLGHLVIMSLALYASQVVGQWNLHCAINGQQALMNHLARLLLRKSAQLDTKTLQDSRGKLANLLACDTEILASILRIGADFIYATLVILIASVLLYRLVGIIALGALVIFLAMIVLGRFCSVALTKINHIIHTLRDRRTDKLSQILGGISTIKCLGWEQAFYEKIAGIRLEELEAHKRLAFLRHMSSACFWSAPILALALIFGYLVLRGDALPIDLIFSTVALVGLLNQPISNLPNILAECSSIGSSANRFLGLFRSDTEEASPDGPRQDATLELIPGEALAITGPTGCGKSTLLKALLQRNLAKNAKTVFCPEEPFILRGTIAENIRFGKKAPERELLQSLALVQFHRDLQGLPKGLATQVGEGGGKLSGGQRQRLALARAAIQEAGLILLDNPISAQDPKTGEAIADQLIFGHWADTTRVIVTDKPEILERCDRVLHLTRSGWTIRQGTRREEMGDSRLDPISSAEIGSSRLSPISVSPITPISSPRLPDFLRQPGVLIRLLLATFIAMGLPLAQNTWIPAWKSQYGDIAGIGVYSLLGLASIISLTLSRKTWMSQVLKGAQLLHDQALKGLLFTNIQFFHTCSQGGILNRFSRDLEVVERELSPALEESVSCLVSLICTLSVIVGKVPLLLLLLIPLALPIYRLQDGFRAAACEARRRLHITRSPLLTSYLEYLHGLSLSKIPREKSFLARRVLRFMQRYQHAFFAMVQLNRWFSIRIPAVTALITLSAGALALYLNQKGTIAAGLFGFIQVCALELAQRMESCIRNFCEVEIRMTSYARLHSLTQLPTEEQDHALAPQLASSLREAPSIHFREVSASYHSSANPVLNKINLQIPAGTVAGVVGRTGSGKSTLLQLLYGFLDPSEGAIDIAGRDLKTLKRQELRQMIAVIPQSPRLFAGTILSNLDMTGTYSEFEIWQILKQFELEAFFLDFPLGLATSVDPQGHTLSLGQKQLICLSRAIIRQSKIIVLDEATACLDKEGETLVQRVIFRLKRYTTVVIVAHKHDALTPCDFVVELVEGRITNSFAKGRVCDFST